MPSLRPLVVELIPVLMLGLLAGWQAAGPHPVGMADNGDYAKMLSPFDIVPAPGHEKDGFSFFNTDFLIDPAKHWEPGYAALERVFVWTAREIAKTMLPAGRFNTRILGVLHGTILLLAAWFFVRASRAMPLWRRILVAFFVVLVLSDIEYVQYLSTPYMDAPAILFALLAIGVGANALSAELPHWGWAAAFGTSGALFLGSKMQHAACALALVVFCTVIAVRWTKGIDRFAWVLAAIVLVFVPWKLARKTPRDHTVDAHYNVIFGKILPSDNKALPSFRLPPEYAEYVAVPNAFQPGSPMHDYIFRERFALNVTTARLVRYYWRHPGVVLRILHKDLAAAANDICVRTLGQMRRVDNPVPRARVRAFVWWSGAREASLRVFPFHVVLVLFPAVVWSSVRLVMGSKNRLWPVLLMTSLMSLISFAVASLMDYSETPRHLILFHVATDFVFACVICCADFGAIGQRLRSRRMRQAISETA